MKNGSSFWGVQFLSLLCIVAFLYAVAPLNVLADGCFVVPKFVWDKHRDINEPTQKAIIAYDAGHEEMLLQVKYEGPLDQFGWLIPVPNLPTVKKGSMACFYELSKFTQKNLEPRWATAGLSKGTYGAAEEEPTVKVIEIKTVGAYDVTVLTSKDAPALENWLKKNQFALPADAGGVIDAYVKQGWYFIAVKIDLKGGSHFSTAEKLASGELNPLQISFASERCVFPLKISSINHTPSEVQAYVLSPEPLIERGLFEKDLAGDYEWRTNRQAELAKMTEQREQMQARLLGRGMTSSPPVNRWPDYRLSLRSEINRDKLTEYALVEQKDIPVCTREMALLNQGKIRWLMKLTRTFKPEEMRDLEFEPAVRVLTAALADPEGAFAAGNLMRLGTSGTSALIAAMQNTNPAVRVNAMVFAEEMTVAPASKPEEGSGRPVLNPALLRLLPTLLDDPDPEVRLHAAYAVENSSSTAYFDRMLKLARDDNNGEVSEAALGYLRAQRDEVPKHIPVYRQMLKETNENAQIAGLRLLISVPDVDIPREDLLALFSAPRLELAGVAVGRLKKEGISCEEAKSLLGNSLWMARMMGLAVLIADATNQSVELAIPLLKDPVDAVRIRASDALADLTGQDFPADQPEQWEKWWEQNKATFTVTISPDELRKKQLERQRERMRRIREEGSPP
jgi:hypothetical protein